MAEPRRLKRAATSGWLAGCCAVAVSLMFGAQAFAVVTVTVDTTDGVQGGDLTLTMGLERAAADPLVSGAQTDILFNTTQIELIGSCACLQEGPCPNNGAACQASADCGQDENNNVCVPPCAASAAVNPQDFTANLPETVRPPDQPPSKRLRLGVVAFANPNATYEGDLITCTFHVRSDATPGQPVSLTTPLDRLNASDPNTQPIPNVQVRVMPGVIKMATPTPTPTITPTPTPTIPCFVDQDCPRGQVCENKVCVPAPTPTPTIACAKNEDCPDGLKCIDANGQPCTSGNCVCRDLSTPTPTPTPLPTCTIDQDCIDLEGPGFHCRAGVCVPERQCDNSTQCRGGPRETCVDHTCECLGDCNLDGKVLGNETSIMTCILRGQCEQSDCPAGGADGNGQVTGSDLCMALNNLGYGCPAEGQPLVLDRTDEIRSLDIGSATGIAGASVTLGVGLSCPSPGCPAPPGADVATAQLDLLIDTSVLELPVDVTELDCAVAPGQPVTEASYTYEPQTPGTPAAKFARLRLFVGNTDLCKPATQPPYPLTPIDAGPLVSCKFRINPNAQPGTYPVTADRLNVGDPQGAVFGSLFTPGAVTVQAPPPCASNSECPEGTHCRDGACKGIRACSGPMAGPSECRDGREACIDSVCECAADCSLDGRVRNDELTTVANIFTGQSELSVCPAVDVNGDDRLRNNELTITAINFTQGCP